MKEFNIPEGWTFQSLYDLVDVIGGVSYTPEDISSSGIRIIRGGNIQGNFVVFRDDDVFLPDKYKNCDNTLRKGDIVLVASTGSVEALGRTATIWDDMENVQIGAFLRILRPKQPKHAALISAWLSSVYYFRYIRLIAKGTSINNISISHIKGFKIPIPTDDILLSFTAFYNALARRININRAINQNLEAFVKQLYDYWFVQFDFPNKEGKPYKSSGGKMVWNETLKKEIPEGWITKQLQDLIVCEANSTTPGSHLRDLDYCPIDEIPIRSMSFAGGKNWQEANSSLQLYDKCDILIGAMRVYFHRCCIASKPGVTRTTTLVLKPRIIEHLSFIYQLCNEERTFLYATKVSTGTQQPYVTWNALSSLDVPYPADEDIISSYCEYTKESINAVLKNVIEINELQSLRDYLIPLLMNGQVTIKD